MNIYVQFATADNLNTLFENLYPLLTIDPLEFHRDYFDIDTCKTDGLDNWGRILDFSRQIIVPDYSKVFGFGTVDNPPVPIKTGYPQNFGHGSFYGGQTKPVILDNDQYRAVLKFRYASLTTNMTLFSINKIMNSYFNSRNPAHKVRVTESGRMQLLYEFNFKLADYERAMFNNRNILPSPGAVQCFILENQIF